MHQREHQSEQRRERGESERDDVVGDVCKNDSCVQEEEREIEQCEFPGPRVLGMDTDKDESAGDDGEEDEKEFERGVVESALEPERSQEPDNHQSECSPVSLLHCESPHIPCWVCGLSPAIKGFLFRSGKKKM